MNFLVFFKEDTKTFNDNPNLNPHRTPSLNREGWGGSPVGVGLNPSPQPLIIMQVTLFREVFYVSETL